MLKRGELFYYNKEDMTNFSKNLAINLIWRRDLPLYESEDEVFERHWFARKKKPMSWKMRDVVNLYESSV